LINPWGVAFSPTGPFWVNNNHTGTATIYNVDPKTNATTTLVTIAPPQAVSGVTTASPTGIVFNPDQNGFMVNGKPATFPAKKNPEAATRSDAAIRPCFCALI
jgi:DNA-binding beta-propeller fold protein YncE